MPQLDRDVLELLAVGGAAAGLVGLLLGLMALRGVARIRRAVGSWRESVAPARFEHSDAIRHVAVVRYDAFADLAGRLSFSVALLDDAGDGVVLTAINGRTEARSYAKGVKGGRGDQLLSPEEEEAIDAALRRAPRPPGPRPPLRDHAVVA